MRLSRREAVAEALAHNPQLEIARAIIGEARARKVEAVSIPDPAVTASLDQQRRLFQSGANGQKNVGIDMLIPFPNKLRLQGKVAQADVASSEYSYALQRQLIAAQTAEAYAHCSSRSSIGPISPNPRRSQRIFLRRRRRGSMRVAYGAVLVLTPRLLTRALPHQQIDARAIAFARVLGIRHLLEATIVGRRRSPQMDARGSRGRRDPFGNDGRLRRCTAELAPSCDRERVRSLRDRGGGDQRGPPPAPARRLRAPVGDGTSMEVRARSAEHHDPCRRAVPRVRGRRGRSTPRASRGNFCVDTRLVSTYRLTLSSVPPTLLNSAGGGAVLGLGTSSSTPGS